MPFSSPPLPPCPPPPLPFDLLQDIHASYLALLRLVAQPPPLNAGVAAGAGEAQALPPRPASAPPSHASAAPAESSLSSADAAAPRPPGLPSHSLLLTPRWLAVVPRVRADWAGIAVNSVGFAGLLLARSGPGVDAIRAASPVGILRACVLCSQPDL